MFYTFLAQTCVLFCLLQPFPIDKVWHKGNNLGESVL